MDYFFNPHPLNSALSPDESRHCILVLRKKAGDEILILNGKGQCMKAAISEPNPKKCRYEIIDERHRVLEKDYTIRIGISPLKNMSRIEWLVEKVVETGVDALHFIEYERTEKRKINSERLHKKAVSALKQSGNLILPQIHSPVSFNDFLEEPPPHAQKFLAVTGKHPHLFKRATQGEEYLIMVGPEGDFTQDELAIATKKELATGFTGEERLRTETAGLVSCLTLQILNA